MKMKVIDFSTKLIFCLLVIFLLANLALPSLGNRKVEHLSSNISKLHVINMSLLEKIGYREGLNDVDISNCRMEEKRLQSIIDSRTDGLGNGGGVYDVEVSDNYLFANYAYARYSSWDISYTIFYQEYIKKCY